MIPAQQASLPQEHFTKETHSELLPRIRSTVRCRPDKLDDSEADEVTSSRAENAGLQSWRSEIAKAAHACQIPCAPTSKRIAKGRFVPVQRAGARRTASRKGFAVLPKDVPPG